jgi:hypothetical protein
VVKTSKIIHLSSVYSNYSLTIGGSGRLFSFSHLCFNSLVSCFVKKARPLQNRSLFFISERVSLSKSGVVRLTNTKGATSSLWPDSGPLRERERVRFGGGLLRVLTIGYDQQVGCPQCLRPSGRRVAIILSAITTGGTLHIWDKNIVQKAGGGGGGDLFLGPLEGELIFSH